MISDFIKKNWPLKLIAFVIALFLWFYVINDGYRVDFLDQEVSIEAFNLEEGVVLAESLGKVNIKVRAPIQSWNKINVDDISAYVDLKGLDPGTYEQEVKVALEDPTIQILEKDPQIVTVIIDELKTISKEVTVVTEGEVEEGYRVGEPSFDFKAVEIKGAQSVLERVNRVVAKIPLQSAMSEILRTVELEALDLNDQKITNIVIIPKTVDVKLPVEVENSVKTVGVKVNLSGEVKAGYWISDVLLSKNTVSVQGDSEVLSRIEFLETEAVNVSGLEAELKRTITLNIPQDVTLLTDEQLQVTIVVESLKTSREINKKPRLVNLQGGLEAKLDPESVRIVVEGSPADVNDISENDIIFDLDLKGKGEGSYTLTLKKESFRMPSRITLKEIKDTQIRLNLSK